MEPQIESKPVAPAPSPRAWQPLTPGGTAAFAQAGLTRVFGVQTIVAGVVGLSVVWLLVRAWEPTVTEAIAQLPEESEVRGGRLHWTGDSPRRLAEGKFLSLVVDLDGSAPLDHTADVQLEFRRTALRVHSLIGYWAVPYPDGWIIAFNRVELEPWLGAWEPVLLAGIALGVVAALLISWAVLGALYAVPVSLVALFFDRAAGLGVGWRLAAMAQMPGALLMAVALVLYGQHQIGLVQLLFAWVAHWGVTGLYLLAAPIFLPRVGDASAAPTNPFSRRSGSTAKKK